MFAYAPDSSSRAGFAMVTDRFVALAGPDVTADVAAALYALLDSETAAIDDVLDVVATQVEVDRLALVQIVDPASRTFQVAVRGAVDVQMEGVTSSTMTGTMTAWVTSEARGVRSLRLALDDSAAVPLLPIRRGVVATTAIEVGREASAARPLRAPESSGTRPITLPRPDEIERDRAERETAERERAASERAASEVASSAERARAEQQRAEQEQTEQRQAEQEQAEQERAQQERERERTDASPAGPHTPGRDADAAAHADLAPAAEPWAVVIPDGTALDLDHPVVFGRRPWRAENTEQMRIGQQVVHVVVPSPHREISGAHLELSLVDGELRARDLDSTNGTLVVTPDRPPYLLNGGLTTPLRRGDILDLGEGFQVVVDAGV